MQESTGKEPWHAVTLRGCSDPHSMEIDSAEEHQERMAVSMEVTPEPQGVGSATLGASC